MKKLTDKEQEKVIAAHATYNGCAEEAERQLPYTSQTIIKYWRKAKLKINNRSIRADGKYVAQLEESQIETIVSAYVSYQGNANAAARNLPFSPPTIKKYWKQRILSSPENKNAPSR